MTEQELEALEKALEDMYKHNSSDVPMVIVVKESENTKESL
jgi:hypothetical protein